VFIDRLDRRRTRDGRTGFVVALTVLSLTTLLGGLSSGCQPKTADTTETTSSADRKGFTADASRMPKDVMIPRPGANLPSDIPADVRAKIQAAQPQPQTQTAH